MYFQILLFIRTKCTFIFHILKNARYNLGSGTVQNQRNYHFSISIVYLIIYFLQIVFYNIHKKFWLLNNKYPNVQTFNELFLLVQTFS